MRLLPDGEAHAAERIIAAVRRLASRRAAPVIVAPDGPSGSGKSTLAGMVAEAIAVPPSSPPKAPDGPAAYREGVGADIGSPDSRCLRQRFHLIRP